MIPTSPSMNTLDTLHCNCKSFTPHMWKPLICNMCFHAKECHHDGVCTGAVSSVRRKITLRRMDSNTALARIQQLNISAQHVPFITARRPSNLQHEAHPAIGLRTTPTKLPQPAKVEEKHTHHEIPNEQLHTKPTMNRSNSGALSQSRNNSDVPISRTRASDTVAKFDNLSKTSAASCTNLEPRRVPRKFTADVFARFENIESLPSKRETSLLLKGVPAHPTQKAQAQAALASLAKNDDQYFANRKSSQSLNDFKKSMKEYEHKDEENKHSADVHSDVEIDSDVKIEPVSELEDIPETKGDNTSQVSDEIKEPEVSPEELEKLKHDSAIVLQTLIRMNFDKEEWNDIVENNKTELYFYNNPYRTQNRRLQNLFEIEKSFTKKLSKIVNYLPKLQDTLDEGMEKTFEQFSSGFVTLYEHQAKLLEKFERKMKRFPKILGVASIYSHRLARLSELTGSLIETDIIENSYLKLRKSKSFTEVTEKLKKSINGKIVPFLVHETQDLFDLRLSSFKELSDTNIVDHTNDYIQEDYDSSEESEDEKIHSQELDDLTKAYENRIEADHDEIYEVFNNEAQEFNELAEKCNEYIDYLVVREEKRAALKQEKKALKQLPRVSEISRRMHKCTFKIHDGKRKVILFGQLSFNNEPDTVYSFFLFTDLLVIFYEESEKNYVFKYGIFERDCPLFFDFNEEKSTFSFFCSFLSDVMDCKLIKPDITSFSAKVNEVFANADLPLTKVFGGSLRVQSLLMGSLGLPHVLTQCCSYLLEPNIRETTGLFRLSGRKQKMEELYQLFDQMIPDIDLSFYSAHEVASILKKWMTSLPSPLIEEKAITSLPDFSVDNLRNYVLEFKNSEDKSKQMTYSVLAYFMKFCKDLSTYADANKMTADNIAIVVGPPLYHEVDPLSMVKINKAISSLIKDCDAIFNEDEE